MFRSGELQILIIVEIALEHRRDFLLCMSLSEPEMHAGAALQNSFMQNSGSNGGAVWLNNVKAANHTLNLFVGNSAPKGSAGIEMNQVTSVVVDQCNFTQGTGSKGGGIYTQVSFAGQSLQSNSDITRL